jgi:hypothetical protein
MRSLRCVEEKWLMRVLVDYEALKPSGANVKAERSLREAV